VYVFSRPEKEPCRGLRPRGAWGVSPVPPFWVTENMAWKASRGSGRRRSPPERCGGIRDGIISRCVSGPLRIGEIARVRVAQRLAGAASCWRGVMPARLRAVDGRNGGIKTRREQGRCPRAWRHRWRAATPSQISFVASHDPLGLSPEDDRRPPARERTYSRRLRTTRVLASLPRKRSGETKRGLPAPGVCDFPSVDRSSR